MLIRCSYRNANLSKLKPPWSKVNPPPTADLCLARAARPCARFPSPPGALRLAEMAANVLQLTLAELQHVLCHGEDFALKEFVWFALDAPADFVEEHEEHCLASRLDVSAAHLASLLSGWLTQGGRPYLEARANVFLTELRRVRETSLLELSFWRSVENLTTELGRTKRRIRYASARLLRCAHTRTPTRGSVRPMRRWVLFGASNMEGGALSQQLGADALVKPEPVAATRAALTAHRAAVVAAAAEEREAAACASAEVEQTASAAEAAAALAAEATTDCSGPRSGARMRALVQRQKDASSREQRQQGRVLNTKQRNPTPSPNPVALRGRRGRRGMRRGHLRRLRRLRHLCRLSRRRCRRRHRSSPRRHRPRCRRYPACRRLSGRYKHDIPGSPTLPCQDRRRRRLLRHRVCCRPLDDRSR